MTKTAGCRYFFFRSNLASRKLYLPDEPITPS